MKKSLSFWMVLVQWVIGVEWLIAGWEKFAKPNFMDGIEKTLRLFASKSSFGSYARTMNNLIIPHANFVGQVVRVSELLLGLLFILSGLVWLRVKTISPLMRAMLTLGLLWGAFLNLNFFLASSWTGPSTEGVNFIMGAIQVVLAAYLAFGSTEKNKVARAK